MFFIKLVPFFIFIVSSTIFSSTNGASQIQFQPFIHGIIKEVNKNDFVSSETSRRSLLAENKSMVLAAERTHRKDPLDNFKYYKRGWNISEKHYFYSVAFTAAPIFFIAVIWFLGFVVILSVICIRKCCCKLKHYGYSRTAYTFTLLFLIFFTISAIIGCIVLYIGQEKFHDSCTSTLNYVVKQADNTVQNLTTVSEYLSAAKGVGVDQIFLPPKIQESISKVDNMINGSADTLREHTNANSDQIRKVLDTVRVILITVAAVLLFLSLAGFLVSIFGLQTFVYILTIIGWILVTFALALCCLFLILHNVVGDTCVAMEEWVENPTARTALDDILPCVDKSTAQQILSESEQVTFQLVGVVNLFINNVSNIDPPKNLPPNVPPETKHLYYNQSGPQVPILCNPFHSDSTNRICAPDEVNFTNASKEWSKYICQVSINGSCSTTGRLTPEFYKQMIFAVNVSYALNHYGPFLSELVDCSFVREIFSGILEDHCPGLNRYSGWSFIGFVMVSAAIMLSLIFWVLHGRESGHFLNTKQFVNVDAQDELQCLEESNVQ